MAQEMIHHLDLRYSRGNLVIKLDMSKAYDRVNWNFLITMNQKIGIPPRFLTFIKHAIQNCWFTVLVNGEAAGLFKSSHGLRQGDPISPALFILAAEAFSRGLDLLFNVNPEICYQMKCKAKSAFILGKKPNLIAQRVKSITGFSMKALPITYLGVPLYKGNKKKMLYENLIDKVRAKISGWEEYHLSYGGRLLLIKTVLSSMPIYLLQVLYPPVGII
ncbi:UNVERIFIED_CONTAM: hypothetical protein Slati_0869500 [Sesamum latifolium]|uniref:Reverse transcriptase domain-containing protein n=1 Tax=Sesamum latifolium TaxID=2727402 RepID=A0AAW2XNX8_9LAMI